MAEAIIGTLFYFLGTITMGSVFEKPASIIIQYTQGKDLQGKICQNLTWK